MDDETEPELKLCLTVDAYAGLAMRHRQMRSADSTTRKPPALPSRSVGRISSHRPAPLSNIKFLTDPLPALEANWDAPRDGQMTSRFVGFSRRLRFRSAGL